MRLFIRNVIRLDPATGNVTLPMYKGRANGQDVWYIVTESSEEKDAEHRGINPAPKLANALGTAAVQRATLRNGVVGFAGTVDFSPTHVVVPGPEGFPPAKFAPGAVGDAKYSPLFTTGNGIVLNASHVANATGVHDAVVSIDFAARQVTLAQFRGFYDGKEIVYLHQDGSTELVAVIEGTTFAPNLHAALGLASDDKKTSAREAIIPIVNGPRGVNNPERQGLQSALLGESDPLNIIQEEPGDNEYSPVWDLHLASLCGADSFTGIAQLSRVPQLLPGHQPVGLAPEPNFGQVSEVPPLATAPCPAGSSPVVKVVCTEQVTAGTTMRSGRAPPPRASACR